MGRFDQFVMVRDGAKDVVRESFADNGVTMCLGQEQGWTAGRWDPRDEGRIRDAVVDIANKVREPVIGAWIYDSDFAYVVGTGANAAICFTAMLGRPYAVRASDKEFVGQIQWGIDRDTWLEETSSGISAWSQEFAPTTVSPIEVRKLLMSEPVFVEEALADLGKALGLPNLNTAVFNKWSGTPVK